MSTGESVVDSVFESSIESFVESKVESNVELNFVARPGVSREGVPGGGSGA